jgi:hypothetical protein
LKAQQDPFREFCVAETTLSSMKQAGNHVTDILDEAFHHIFNSTTDILTAHLAWIFMSNGFAELNALREEELNEQVELLKQHF